MKKIFSYAMLLLAGTFAMTSCEKDLDSNPTLIQPSSFVLNNPEVGNGVVDLEKSDGISITWSQPEYTTKNAPVVATYYVQLSTTAKFTKEFLATAEDNTGADYITLDESSKVCTADINAAEVAKVLQKLNAYAEGVDLAVEKVSLRLKAAVVDQALKEHNVVYSNVVAFNAKPYYVELKDATPVMWYLVGNMFGGKWGQVVGESALPMFLKDGFAYDKKTGTGELEYINYFLTGTFDNTDGNESSVAGFKIQRTDFNWDFGLTGDSGKYGVIKYRDGKKDGGHIVAPENGYYKVTVDTEKLTGKMEKYEGAVTDYGVIQITGAFNDWADQPMSPYNTVGVENHAWYYVLETTGTSMKFKIAGSWDTNWGSTTFPTGIGTNNGKNIEVPAGKWCISFNDITGAYSIVSLQ